MKVFLFKLMAIALVMASFATARTVQAESSVECLTSTDASNPAGLDFDCKRQCLVHRNGYVYPGKALEQNRQTGALSFEYPEEVSFPARFVGHFPWVFNCDCFKAHH
jgi:hypothetical protein